MNNPGDPGRLIKAAAALFVARSAVTVFLVMAGIGLAAFMVFGSLLLNALGRTAH